MTYHNTDGQRVHASARAFEGVITNLERRYRETNSEYIREKISEFMTDRPCPTCGGQRLRPEALAVTVDDANIVAGHALAGATARWNGCRRSVGENRRSPRARRPSPNASSRRSRDGWASWSTWAWIT